MALNDRAAAIAREMARDADDLRIEVIVRDDGGITLDCGVQAVGGLEAGRRLAELCLAGRATVDFAAGTWGAWSGPAVTVRTDHPIEACLASQYAGWKVASNDFFAMASGPMRAAAADEPLFSKISYRETAETAVGVLETRQLPPAETCRQIADTCGVEPGNLLLAVAPTASHAASVQIAARSVETALHKLLELDFDVSTVECGFGTAPVAPVAGDDLTAIGRTNDAILYAADVTLWLRADEAEVGRIGPQVPSSASSDFGQPFAEIFSRYDQDFYKIDPHLFSPARVTLVNLTTGRAHAFGLVTFDVIERSFHS